MKKSTRLLPKHERAMSEFGENIRLARLRRRLSAEQVAQRAGISRKTLYNIERGSPKVGFGSYFQVLLVLGLEKELIRLAKDDKLGRKLQDANLTTSERAPKRKK